VPEELILTYRLEERIPLEAGAPSAHIERWTASVLLDDAANGDDRVEIGYAHVLVFTLEPGTDIGTLADPASGTWIDVDTRPNAPGLSADLGDGSERTGHILLLDRVWLDPDHRGRGLGPLVAAAAIARLGRGCHLAACYPAPFEGTFRQLEDQARAVEALGRVWSKVGFRHWRDGVWMLDLSTHDIQATLAELVAARFGAEP
jgi:GNAT superfamily N-acetyltransferase